MASYTKRQCSWIESQGYYAEKFAKKETKWYYLKVAYDEMIVEIWIIVTYENPKDSEMP